MCDRNPASAKEIAALAPGHDHKVSAPEMSGSSVTMWSTISGAAFDGRGHTNRPLDANTIVAESID